MRSLSILCACVSMGLAFSQDLRATELKLLTLNVWQFPYGIVSRDNNERADKLAELVRIHQSEFDVIAVQEMWSNWTRERMYRQISDLYPYSYEDNEWGYLGLGFHSGLAIYSKYPVNRRLLHTYTVYRGYEDFAKKGVLGVELDVNGKAVYVFTTHLQAGAGGEFLQWLDKGKPNTTDITALQLREARRKIDKFVQDKQAPIFFLGDFNMTAGDEEYQSGLRALVSAKDTFDPSMSSYFGTSWNNFPDKKRIDFILSLDQDVSGYSFITDIFGPSVTDHLGVMGVFQI